MPRLRLLLLLFVVPAWAAGSVLVAAERKGTAKDVTFDDGAGKIPIITIEASRPPGFDAGFINSGTTPLTITVIGKDFTTALSVGNAEVFHQLEFSENSRNFELTLHQSETINNGSLNFTVVLPVRVTPTSAFDGLPAAIDTGVFPVVGMPGGMALPRLVGGSYDQV